MKAVLTIEFAPTGIARGTYANPQVEALIEKLLHKQVADKVKLGGFPLKNAQNKTVPDCGVILKKSTFKITM